jgi:hypothetical protein
MTKCPRDRKKVQPLPSSKDKCDNKLASGYGPGVNGLVRKFGMRPEAIETYMRNKRSFNQ